MTSEQILDDAVSRLEKLIRNSRAQALQPITIAEILFRSRRGEADVHDWEAIRRRSYQWLNEVNNRIFGKQTSLNRSYWNTLFSSHMPMRSMLALDKVNSDNDGIIESYIYHRIFQTIRALRTIRTELELSNRRFFSLVDFLDRFASDSKLCRSIDKAFEIAVHALFNAVATRLEATVTLSIERCDDSIIHDFEEFCQLLLGVDSETRSISLPAALYRAGGTNSRDGGVDLWANFGPAIQIKHIALKPKDIEPIAANLCADELVIVCDDTDVDAIRAVIEQLGIAVNVRGVITKSQLAKWYAKALGPEHFNDMSEGLFQSLQSEFDAEFGLSKIEDFLNDRGYKPPAAGSRFELDRTS